MLRGSRGVNGSWLGCASTADVVRTSSYVVADIVRTTLSCVLALPRGQKCVQDRGESTILRSFVPEVLPGL